MPVHLTIFVLMTPFLFVGDFVALTIVANLFLVQGALGLISINFPSWSASLELVIPPAVAAFALVLRKPPALAAMSVLGVLLILDGFFAVQTAHGAAHDFPRAALGISIGTAGAGACFVV